MSNDNCLAGMRCPECGSYEPFDIRAEVTVTMFDEGSDGDYGYEWNEESLCFCKKCDHGGWVADFREKDDGDEEDSQEAQAPGLSPESLHGEQLSDGD